MRRGDVVLVTFPFIEGRAKRRPAVVVQADALNARLVSAIVASVTSNLRQVGQPTQTRIDPAIETSSGLKMPSAVKGEVRFTADHRTTQLIGHLSQAAMSRIDACLKAAFGLP